MSIKSGKIIYSCPCVPAEWITAHGLLPFRIIPSASCKGPMEPVEGLCPYVCAFVNSALADTQASAVVFATSCDQMRRGFEMFTFLSKLPAFLLNVPRTNQGSIALTLYLDELRRLGKFLCSLGGIAPSNKTLTDIMLQYESSRKTMNVPEYPSFQIPLAIVGGPLMKEHSQMFDAISNYGGNIVLDATETGERCLCPPFDRRRLSADPLAELASAYLSIPDPSRRPNSDLYIWLTHKLLERKVKGIILHRYIWCDIWHAELYHLKQLTSLPVLDLDSTGDTQSFGPRTANRLSAFLEMFR